MAKVGKPRAYDRVKLAADLIEWAKKPENINLCGFCCEFDLDPTSVLEWVRTDEQFAQSYRKAKAYLGVRREKQLSKGTLHQLAYAKNAKTYDPFLKNEEREDATFESSLRKEEDNVKDRPITINLVDYSKDKS